MRKNIPFKTIFLTLAIVFALSFLIAYDFSSAQDTIYYSENFNYGIDDQIPDYWSVSAPGAGSKITIKIPGGHNPFSTNALVAVDIDGSTGKIIGNTSFGVNIENGTFIFDMSAWVSAAFGIRHSYYISLENDSYDPIITINVSVKNPTNSEWTLSIEGQTVDSYNHWDIRHVRLDFASGLLDCDVNGANKLTNVAYKGGNITRIRIESTEAGFGDEIWLDNLLLGEYGYIEPGGGIPGWNLVILPLAIFVISIFFLKRRSKSITILN